MNNAVFRKTMENLGKHRDIKLFETEGRRKYLVSESVEIINFPPKIYYQ